MTNSREIKVEHIGHVARFTICRGPENFFNQPLMAELADGFDAVSADDRIRSIVLRSEGKCFCAGARFSGDEGGGLDPGALYADALRLFKCPIPVVASIQGPAIGGGLGLAVMADFRIASPEARLAANFVKIGISPGFGLTYTLPRLIGRQNAQMLMLSGRRLTGEEALGLGLVDEVVPAVSLDAAAMALAEEIASNAPLAVRATRALLRAELYGRVEAQLRLEEQNQLRLFASEDFREGARAVAERRQGKWSGR